MKETPSAATVGEAERTLDHWKDSARYRFAATLANLCILVTACSSVRAPLEHDQFVVLVAGDGVDSAKSSERVFAPLNRALARQVWVGVTGALKQTPFTQVRFEHLDDDGQVRNAGRVAREAVGRPEVLAVIGHASTGTTAEGLPHWVAAGVPVVMPIATGAGISAPRVFRLPANDTTQAAAGVALLNTLLAEMTNGKIYYPDG